MDSKICTRCAQEKELAAFPQQYNWNKDKTIKYTSYRGICKTCKNKELTIRRRVKGETPQRKANLKARREKWQLENPQQYKRLQHNNYCKRRYGITSEEYYVLRDEHTGCSICGNTTKRGLALDHDHQTGKLRGFLCHDCNTGIGLLKDSPELMTKAIAYIVHHKGG